MLWEAQIQHIYRHFYNLSHAKFSVSSLSDSLSNDNKLYSTFPIVFSICDILDLFGACCFCVQVIVKQIWEDMCPLYIVLDISDIHNSGFS
jgi:hypothetical protein